MKWKEITHLLAADRDMLIRIAILLIVGACALFFFRDKTSGDSSETASKDSTTISVAYAKDADRTGKDKYFAVAEKPVRLQEFDPNTADSTLLLGLGLQAWQVRSIYRYRAAGGVYTCPEDFARLYGLSAKKFRELRPYIRISPDYRPASEVYGKTQRRSAGGNNVIASSPVVSPSGGSEATTSPYPQKLKQGQTLRVNSADTLSLRQVPGIGAYFARKIIRYRDQLGGFISKDQLLEIQDFPESALPYLDIASGSSDTRKLNINKASAEQLRHHPYISYQMARSILDFRRMRGSIKDLNDLKLLPSFTPEVIAKLRPYIAY